MSDDQKDAKLLALGHELSEQLLRHSHPRDNQNLYQARRRALETATSKHHDTTRIGGWLTATAVAGVAVLVIMIIPRMWDGTSSQHQPDQHNDFLSKNFMEDEAPWHENLDMLQNMDFTLWLDMAEPEEDAG